MTVYAIQPDRIVEMLPVEALGWCSYQVHKFAGEVVREQYGDDCDWYNDGNLIAEWQKWCQRVRRRIEDRIRKDGHALVISAKAMNINLS